MRTLLTLLSLACISLAGIAQEKPATPSAPAAPVSQNPKAIIHTTAGDITCELYQDKAPKSVANFIGLATGTKDWRDPATHAKKHGVPLYDGTIFHRVIPGFMIQGGDPLGSGQGDPGYGFGLEVSPDLNYDQPGRLAYARTQDPNSNGSQFFITEAPYPSLNQQYTIFGQCGQHDVVEKIASADRDANDKPYHPTKITHIQIVKAGDATTTPKTGTTHKATPAKGSSTKTASDKQ